MYADEEKMMTVIRVADAVLAEREEIAIADEGPRREGFGLLILVDVGTLEDAFC